VQLCDPLRMVGLRGEVTRVSVLARQDAQLSIEELEGLSRERLAGVEDPVTALRRALEGRAEVTETASGITITIAFGFDEARNANASTVSTQIGTTFRDLPVRMTIEGHTDSVGSSEYNMALGQRRAEVVAFGIGTAGFDRTSLATRSMGKEQPLVAADDPASRERNRRVIISISPEW
jgi:outer membrane protein OmpA-like peptidoglycan-associated protein